jgi:hypothetical protein
MLHSDKLEFVSFKVNKEEYIHFLVVLPDVTTSVCSKEVIKHRFLEAGESRFVTLLIATCDGNIS